MNKPSATYHHKAIDVRNIFTSITPLSEKGLRKLVDRVSPVEHHKGYMLFEAEKKDRDLYFISQGVARAYCMEDVNEVTVQIATEGELLVSLKSYIENKPGYENIELLEPCQLFRLPYRELQSLYNQEIEIANWGRKMVEKELIRTEERFISRQFKPAAQRYADLMAKNPYLTQRVQLGHIASYLGVSQVTLSRIRAEVR
ncbi:CRP-like cAMP-binding protein [Dysgonomonas sp. PH5-45]|uniref:Crp/Fnr family transcriptional regulator n=1 Tax=unclassified Dysgonomonas TaxID=2630389 RepID=UPI002475E070|nr:MULTISPECIES: Crp/Fnr family transcriptional regulator [unclassified Dysgonomonas]MDH6353816.1 CRP-like cAMP-binding protein [Dysgonomonas sp. PH5-45]MDH6386718.1 CRP-like cAMP-binding protein [Dysgonomonas sp. PH5-37]